MELNSEKCHNFGMANKLGHCPFITVCNSDCVYVWKAYYDSRKDDECAEERIEELESKISDLESDITSYQKDADDANSRAEDAEVKYDEMIDDLARVMNDDSIDKLCNYRDDGKVGEWAEEVCSRRIKI